MNGRGLLRFGAALCLLFVAVPADGQIIIYVDDDASLGGDGTSWSNAFNDIQDALVVAGLGDDIRVAQGTYTPSDCDGGECLEIHRAETFQLKNGVALYGGFAGLGTPNPNLRDIEVYETILSGDLSNNDVVGACTTDSDCFLLCVDGSCLIAGFTGENSFNIVTGSGTDATAILDGFTITGGNANGTTPTTVNGGGMINIGSPTVTHCTFRGNFAFAGGGMSNGGSSSTISNCTFSGNIAQVGGGMSNSGNPKGGGPTIVNCIFSSNFASGMTNWSSSPTLTNCIFIGNRSNGGGGMRNLSGSSPNVTNCVFSGNIGDGGGGGMLNEDNSNPILINCTFSRNISNVRGGGITNVNGSSPALTNCILWGDGPDEIWNLDPIVDIPIVSFSNVQGGLPPGTINGSGNIVSDPLFVDTDGSDNTPGTDDDDLRLSSGSPCIDAGDNGAVPPDVTTDLLCNQRFIDDPNTPDTGVGTPPIVDIGAYEFGAPPVCDGDGDGLFDDWEINGIDVNGDGIIDLDLPAMGANPNHKDLFIEVDSMVDARGGQSLAFDSVAQQSVIQAFADAPNDLVDNPDGLKGITLHLVADETNLPFMPFPNGFDEFDLLKADHFGSSTPAERAAPNWPNVLVAKKNAFRYCIFGHSHGTTTSSGLGELPGNDFMVTLGLWPTPGGTVDQQAGVFMHELGHNLGLSHSGPLTQLSEDELDAIANRDDRYNRKPNYYSLMSYTWQVPKANYASYWRLDYSHVKLATLQESALDESAGIDGSDPDFAAIMTPYGIGGEPPGRAWAKTNGDPVDWNGNSGNPDPGTVAVDINYLFQCCDPPMPCPSPDQDLEGHADWPNLRYALFGANFADGVHDVTTEDTEMTVEIFEQMDAIPPPPGVCLADLDGDGQSDLADFSVFPGCMSGPGQPLAPGCEPNDIDVDGNVDLVDFAIYQIAFGCP